jgi:hypothetical protein
VKRSGGAEASPKKHEPSASPGEGVPARVGVEQSGFGALSPAGLAHLKAPALGANARAPEPDATTPGPEAFDRNPGVRLYNARLFIQGAGDVNAIDANDVGQGQLGDCYLLASLCAMARTPEGRARLKSIVEEKRDDRGRVTSYAVALKQRDDAASRKAGKDVYRDVRVEVPPDFQTTRLSAKGDARHTDLVKSDAPDAAVVAGAARAGDSGADGSVEVWVAVIEKAYANMKGGFSAIGHGGFADEAMPALTGASAARKPFEGPGAYWPVDLKADLAAGKLVTIGTPATLPTTGPGGAAPYGLVGPHAYVVTGSFEKDGKVMVQLYNPHGVNHPPPVPFDELVKYATHVSVGDIESAP